MSKSLCPNCSHEIIPPVWHCMKGHVICTKCCKRTSVCPTCAFSTVICGFCEQTSTDIVQHLIYLHSFNGAYFIYSSLSLEIKANVDEFFARNVYKRIVDQEERIYAVEVRVKNEMLSAHVSSIGKTSENVRYCIADKKREHLMMFFAKTGHEDFLASLKPIRQHFASLNSEGQDMFRLEIDFGDEYFYI